MARHPRWQFQFREISDLQISRDFRLQIEILVTHIHSGISDPGRTLSTVSLLSFVVNTKIDLRASAKSAAQPVYASSFARCAAFTTALIRVTRSLPSSSSIIPSIVHPAGVVTASFNSAG